MRKIGEILVQEGLVRPAHVERALWWQRDDGGRIGSLLIRLGYIEEREFLRLMATQLRTRPILIGDAELDPRLIAMLPTDTARQANAIPIAIQNGHLVIATSDPNNVRALREIQAATGHPVEAWLAADPSIASALDRYYPRLGVRASPAPATDARAGGAPSTDSDRRRSIESVVDGWIAEALAGGAESLMVRMTPRGLRVRGEAEEGGFDLGGVHSSVFTEVMSCFRTRASLRQTAGPARRETGVLRFDHDGQPVWLGITLIPDVYGFSARVSLAEARKRAGESGEALIDDFADQIAS